MKDILIVEDGRLDRERLTELFSEAGYSVTPCQSAREAEAALSTETFRLAILDIGLGDRSGSHLFDTIQRGKRAQYTLIFTGNPSVHLRQRFLDEGAIDYIVKATAEAQPDQLLTRVRDLLGAGGAQLVTRGIALADFVTRFLKESSRPLFLDGDGGFVPCRSCGARSYLVRFDHQPQMPPDVVGQVVCGGCGQPMDPEIG